MTGHRVVWVIDALLAGFSTVWAPRAICEATPELLAYVDGNGMSFPEPSSIASLYRMTRHERDANALMNAVATEYSMALEQVDRITDHLSWSRRLGEDCPELRRPEAIVSLPATDWPR